MPDIAMCQNQFCPSNKSCYRFMATPNDWQSYANFKVPEGEDKCDNYWSIIEIKEENDK